MSHRGGPDEGGRVFVAAKRFNVVMRCGLSPYARQIRAMVEWLWPVTSAINRVLQCVRFAGVVCSMRSMIAASSAI